MFGRYHGANSGGMELSWEDTVWDRSLGDVALVVMVALWGLHCSLSPALDLCDQTGNASGLGLP